MEGQERHALQHLRARAVLQGAVGQVHLPDARDSVFQVID